MSLEIIDTNNSSEARKEIIRIKVTAEKVDLSEYAIVDRTFDNQGNISDIFRHFFRFPPHVVRKGELVVLAGGKKPYTFETTNGVLTHIFYWGTESCVWNNEGDSAILIRIQEISRMRVNPLK